MYRYEFGLVRRLMTDKWYLLAGALLSRCMYIVANVKDVMSRNPLFKGTPLGHHTRQHGFPHSLHSGYSP